MRKVIHHIRKQPEENRRHLLHILTLVSAFILLSLWVFTLSSDLSAPASGENLKAELAPFSVLKDNIIGGYKSISE
jgi:hypothetical protein